MTAEKPEGDVAHWPRLQKLIAILREEAAEAGPRIPMPAELTFQGQAAEILESQATRIATQDKRIAQLERAHRAAGKSASGRPEIAVLVQGGQTRAG